MVIKKTYYISSWLSLLIVVYYVFKLKTKKKSWLNCSIRILL